MANDVETVQPETASAETAQVDIRDRASLEKWTKALGVTGEALESAVKAVGPSIEKIKVYLTGGQAGSQSDG